MPPISSVSPELAGIAANQQLLQAVRAAALSQKALELQGDMALKLIESAVVQTPSGDGQLDVRV